MWILPDAVKYLDKHAESHSLARCAEYVRKAIEAGGVTLVHHVHAKDYGGSLTPLGFQSIDAAEFYKAGDVAIIQPIEGDLHGHMTMYDGTIWVSDYKQYHGLYPNQTYRKLKPAFEIFRYPYVVAMRPPRRTSPFDF